MSQWQPQATRSCVAVRARDCSNAFAAYLTDPAQISDREEWAEEQQARFNIWAANLGVFADGHASIDHRLRDSSKTYCLIFQLLDALYANLNYCKLKGCLIIYKTKLFARYSWSIRNQATRKGDGLPP